MGVFCLYFRACFDISILTSLGGTGKTHLIETLANKITLDYQIKGREREEPPVIIAAPTGFAALAVKGTTLHSLFRLQVDQKKHEKYQGLKFGYLFCW